MVVPCVPCAVAAAPSVGPPIAALFGVGATAIAAKRSLKKKKKTKKNKTKKKLQKGGSVSLKKDMQNYIDLRKKKYSKKYKKINKEKKKKCCKCHYVKAGKTLRRVKGPYPHCSYDSNNCCKDKKTIV